MKLWKIALINAAATLVVLFLVEAVASIAWYQKDRPYDLDRSAAVSAIRGLLTELRAYDANAEKEESKLDKVLALRERQPGVLPAYLYDPQLHIDQRTYYLANPANATVVLCNESGTWTVFDTDELGFRNPRSQIGRAVDFVFLGDSYVEGACVDDEDTIAGAFRAAGHSVMNLGRSGSGPLFQLAVLREYGDVVEGRTLVWYVFAANDLKNLREEKTTRLFRYLEDESYTQRLFERRDEVSRSLTAFLEEQVVRAAERQQRSLPFRYERPYGESLDVIEAERDEIRLFDDVASRIVRVAEGLGMNVLIVVLEHPKSYYNQEVQEITSNAVRAFARANDVPLLELDRGEFESAHEELFATKGTHFAPVGYRLVAARVLETLDGLGLRAARNGVAPGASEESGGSGG